MYIARLIHKVREKETLTLSEWNDLQAWRRADPRNEELFRQLQDRDFLEEEVRALLAIDYQDSANELYERLGLAGVNEKDRGVLSRRRDRGQPLRTWLTPAAAAAVLILCGGLYLWLQKPSKKGLGPAPAVAKTDVAPGRS